MFIILHFLFRSRNVKCQKNICEAVFIAHLSYVEYTCYEFAVKFHNIKSFHQKYAINIITFTVCLFVFVHTVIINDKLFK